MNLPDGLAVKPWKHQVDAYTFAMTSLERDRAALLAAGMGCGKTLMGTMIALGRGAKLVLVVCPLRVIPSWREQLNRFLAAPHSIAALDDKIGTTAKRAALAQNKLELAKLRGETLFVIANYDAFWQGALGSWVARQWWDLVIYDESHRIKSPGGKASLFARALRARTRAVVLASGTPMPHSPLDVYGQFRAAAPQVFGKSWTLFRSEFAVLGGPEKRWILGYKNVAKLEAKIAPLTYRISKREALPDLPEEQEVDYKAPFSSAEARRIYAELERDLITDVEGKVLTAANALTRILRLQQVTGGSVPTDDGVARSVCDAKRKLLVDTLEDLGDEPVVIFCRFRADIAAAHAACEAAGVKSLELSGVADDLAAWQAGEAQALVVQVQSGSEGISLVRANVAIFYSISSSLKEYDQARSRIHRPGQARKCLYIYLAIENTIDEEILAALRRRAEVIEAIMCRIQARAFKGFSK